MVNGGTLFFVDISELLWEGRGVVIIISSFNILGFFLKIVFRRYIGFFHFGQNQISTHVMA